MDLSSIRDKLDRGSYKDPWEFVDDVWLMFDNAWLYNKPTSRVYKYCTKVNPLLYHSAFLGLYFCYVNVSVSIEFQLAEIFEGEIDGVMQRLGYCCGRKYVFQPQILCCMGKELCTIPREATYYHYQDRYVGSVIQCCVSESVFLLDVEG